LNPVLHIGAPKTGTSALQSFLSANRARLDFAYPPGPGDLNAARGIVTTGNAFEIARSVELDDGPAKDRLAPDTVYSSERFWSVDIDRLAAWLDGADATVVFYARPQVAQIAASFHQRVRNNGYAGAALEWFEEVKARKLYARRYLALGRNARVVARKYDRRLLRNGDIVDDFFGAIGRPIPAQAVRFADINRTSLPLPFDRAAALRIATYFEDDNARLAELLGPDFDLNADNLRAVESLTAAHGAGRRPDRGAHGGDWAQTGTGA
jgi:hypothetical protein